jgi:hypothetical protein
MSVMEEQIVFGKFPNWEEELWAEYSVLPEVSELERSTPAPIEAPDA